MKCLVGKVLQFEAIIGVTAPSSCKSKVMVCLESVTTSEGLFRDHAWVERKDGYPPKGTKVSFRSRVRKYLSLEEYKQVTKIGLSTIKNMEVVR